MSAGGGYVLSKEALRLLVEKALQDPKLCKKDDTGAEDAEMGVWGRVVQSNVGSVNKCYNKCLLNTDHNINDFRVNWQMMELSTSNLNNKDGNHQTLSQSIDLKFLTAEVFIRQRICYIYLSLYPTVYFTNGKGCNTCIFFDRLRKFWIRFIYILLLINSNFCTNEIKFPKQSFTNFDEIQELLRIEFLKNNTWYSLNGPF